MDKTQRNDIGRNGTCKEAVEYLRSKYQMYSREQIRALIIQYGPVLMDIEAHLFKRKIKEATTS